MARVIEWCVWLARPRNLPMWIVVMCCMVTCAFCSINSIILMRILDRLDEEIAVMVPGEVTVRPQPGRFGRPFYVATRPSDTLATEVSNPIDVANVHNTVEVDLRQVIPLEVSVVSSETLDVNITEHQLTEPLPTSVEEHGLATPLPVAIEK